MKNTKKEIKRLKRAEKNGARIQFFSDLIGDLITLKDKATWVSHIEYRIHPEDENNYDEKGRKYLKPEELVKGEWYRMINGNRVWIFRFNEIDKNVSSYMIHDNICILNERCSYSSFLCHCPKSKLTKATKKQIKKAKKILGIEDSINPCKSESEQCDNCTCDKSREKKVKELKVDFSILNDTDVFYVRCLDMDFIVKGNPIKHNIGFNLKCDNIYENTTCRRIQITELRHATKEEKQKIYELRPDLIPDDYPLKQWVNGMSIWDHRGRKFTITNKGRSMARLNDKNPQKVVFQDMYPYPVKVVRK